MCFVLFTNIYETWFLLAKSTIFCSSPHFLLEYPCWSPPYRSLQELTETACPTELLTLDAPVTYKYTPTGNGALLDRTARGPAGRSTVGMRGMWWTVIQSGNGKAPCSIGISIGENMIFCCLARLPESYSLRILPPIRIKQGPQHESIQHSNTERFQKLFPLSCEGEGIEFPRIFCRNDDYYKTVWYRDIGERSVRTFDSVKVGKGTAERKAVGINGLSRKRWEEQLQTCDWDVCSNWHCLIVVIGCDRGIQLHTSHKFLGSVKVFVEIWPRHRSRSVLPHGSFHCGYQSRIQGKFYSNSNPNLLMFFRQHPHVWATTGPMILARDGSPNSP